MATKAAKHTAPAPPPVDEPVDDTVEQIDDAMSVLDDHEVQSNSEEIPDTPPPPAPKPQTYADRLQALSQEIDDLYVAVKKSALVSKSDARDLFMRVLDLQKQFTLLIAEKEGAGDGQ